MAKIRVLNDRLINKIAAGEVVERPASALKEMLENSLDAGARELRIDLEAGGKQLIRVLDDGEGMDADDVLMALERHATSKIREFDDLEEVTSLGFRGEALPSIASVSRMKLRSRTKDSPEGREVEVIGGEIRDVKPCAMAPGTEIEVRTLFFNVPARRKFLRTTLTEFGHCQSVATHYALAFPEISLRLRHNGAGQIDAPPAASLRDRIAQVLGEPLLERLTPFEESIAGVRVVGFAGEPAMHRADTSMLHFYVNRRAVRDKVLIHAVRSAYEDLLPKRRAPVAFLFIELPPSSVDVNVHPSKTEIRFRSANDVHDAVVGALRAALSRSQPIAAYESKPSTRPEPRAETGSEESTLESLERALKRRADRRDAERRLEFEEPAAPATRSERAQPPARSESPQSIPEPPFPPVEPRRFRGGEIEPEDIVPLGQVENSYIVARIRGGLMIVDQHAAHERVRYEALTSAAAKENPPRQGLLHPVVVDLPPARARLVEEHREAFSALGFDVEAFGPGSIAIRALPAGFEPEEAEDLLAGMAADLERLGNAPPDKLLKELVISASCQGAVKVNTPLSREKMAGLLEDLFRCEMPMRCPHGRPVVLTIGEDELRRRFGRS